MTLCVHDLSISIGSVNVCKDFTYTFSLGQCWAILGRNGVGKTTFLHTLAGLHTANSGEVLIDHSNLKSLTRRNIAQRLAILLQETDSAFPSSVIETVLLGRHPFMSRWAAASQGDINSALSALCEVGLDSLASRDFATLSGGEKRRVELATLICQNVEIVLLDEPVNHLDMQHQIRTLAYFSQLAKARQKLVIVVLHDVNLAVKYCDHAMLMFGENSVELGQTAKVINIDALTRLYETPIRQIESYFIAE